MLLRVHLSDGTSEVVRISNADVVGIDLLSNDLSTVDTFSSIKRGYYNDNFIVLPKPKEAVIENVAPEMHETECGYSIRAGVNVLRDAVRRWQADIDAEVQREVFRVFCEEYVARGGDTNEQ